MENLESIWQVGLLALVAGAMLGALAYRLFAPSLTRADKVKSDLEEARQELIDYKASVNSHFDKTSELVNDLTQNYVKVYQHLAEGAQTLGDSRELNQLLEQQPGKVLLTVDDESPLEETDAAVVESVESSTTPAGPVAEAATAEPEVEEAAGGETGSSLQDKPAEPEVAAAADDSTEPELASDEEAKTEAASDSVDAADTSAGEPRIDVSKIERGAAEAGEAETELGTLIPESGKSAEVKPTRH